LIVLSLVRVILWDRIGFSDINKCWNELMDPAELPQPKQDRYTLFSFRYVCPLISLCKRVS